MDALDELGMDVRVHLMERTFDDDTKENAIGAVVAMLHACDVLDVKMAGLRSYVAPTALAVAGLGAIATRLPAGRATDAVAAVLLVLSVLPWLLLAPISRAEVVAKRVRFAAEALEKYVVARENDAAPTTGVRVEEAGAGVVEETGAFSADAPVLGRKGSP